MLYAGRMSIEKKLDILLEAFSRLDRDDSFLLLVGGGPDLERLKSKARKLGLEDVAFAGFVDNGLLNRAYSEADVFVSPSDTETFGLTFIEAMSVGTPVIGVDKLGPKELITNGKTGYLAKAGDAGDISRRIDQILSNDELRWSMGQNALELSERYSIERCMQKTISIYEDALDQNCQER